MAIINGTFDTDLSGWTITKSGDDTSTVTWVSPGIARLELLGAQLGDAWFEMKQSFMIDDIAVYFQYRCVSTGAYNRNPAWSLTIDTDPITTIAESLNNNYWRAPWVTWTRAVDVSMYIGKTATISFYDGDYGWGGNDQIVEIDNVGIGKAGSVDFITDPPGANIWLKDMDGIWSEWWNRRPDGSNIDPWITPFTASQMIPQDYMFKLCGYADYVGTLVMTGLTGTIDVTFSPSSTIVNLDIYPSGAEIYVDGADKRIKTPASVTVGPISGCEHTFTFRRSGYFDYMRTETLVGAGPITISGNMVPLVPIPPCP